MASKNDALLIAVGLFAVYTLTSKPSGPPSNSYFVPPGGTLGGATNNSGYGIWVNLAGQIFNAVGQIIGYFTTQKDPVTQEESDLFDWISDTDDLDGDGQIGAVRTSRYTLPNRAGGWCSCANGRGCASSASGTCECCDTIAAGHCDCANGKQCTSSPSGTCECCDSRAVNPFQYALKLSTSSSYTSRAVGGL